VSKAEPQGYFITGTDTGSGKTVASVMLLQALKKNGRKVCGMKPVASGCLKMNDSLVSDDAVQLMKHSSIRPAYELVNPVALQTPCSPNIAAELEGLPVDIEKIVLAYKEISRQADIIVVEGVGGWFTPVFGTSGMEVLVTRLQLSVILVVGLRLGCINHALLTAAAIRSCGINLVGWIANHVDPDFLYSEQTVSCLSDTLNCRLLGEIPFKALPNELSCAISCLDIMRLERT